MSVRLYASTNLIVLNAHAAVLHSGATLNYIRLTYGIVKSRYNVKQLLKRNYICKYVQGKCLLGQVPFLPEF